MSYWWAHAACSILACIFLKKVSKYYVTWILIASAIMFSNQTRFSLEFILMAIGLSAWAFSDQYLKTSQRQKFIMILSLVIISVVFTIIGKSLNEKYAFLAWLPVLVTFYFPLKERVFEKKNFIATSLSTLLVLFSSKKSVLIGFFAQYLSVIRSFKSFLLLTLISISIFFTSFLFQDNLKHFYRKSISPRVVIWQSAAKGFIHKPIGGNGFGIFPMEVNAYRKSVKKIGGKLNEHLNHAHNNFLQIAFEQGLIGLALFALLLIFLFINHSSCFWTFLTLSILDASLVYTSQYFFAALIFIPSILRAKPVFDRRFFVIPEKYQSFTYNILLFLCLIVFSFSSFGHYYYDQRDYEMAIKFDADHSLYQFFMGVENFKNQELEEAAQNFKKSIDLSKNHGFQQGFLAVTFYQLGAKDKALKWISESLRLAGDEAQWKYIAHVMYQESDPEYSQQLKTEAITKNPLLSYYDKGLMPPKLSSIGGIAGSNFWINSYQRRGELVFLPTPQY